MKTFKRTNSDNPDFQYLVKFLDEELKVADGEEHSFYAQYNKIDSIRNVIVFYVDGKPAGCGAFKQYKIKTAELKRMYVLPEFRRNGIANCILTELELWSAELSYSKCILETGLKQIAAVRLYEKSGYLVIPNYGQYKNVLNSVCMEKQLRTDQSDNQRF